MDKKRLKVAVTGAAGQIGYAILFRIASGQMFGPETEVELNLVEIPPVIPALEGVKMELEDCAFPLLKKVFCTAELSEGFKDIDWAILVGSAPRKDGMERSDLLKKNGGIFVEQGKALNDYANPNCKTFVVGNPCNTNCLIAMNNAPKIPKENFFAMTMLDENRAKTQLAIKSGKDITEISSNMTIWGNHSATQYLDFFNTRIAGKKVVDVIDDETWLKGPFIETVQKRGAAVIKARGASSAASAANAAIQGVYNLTHETPEGETFSMALASSGQYGVDEGLIFSYPCRVENGVVKVVEGFEHNEFGKEKFQKTLEELRNERDIVL